MITNIVDKSKSLPISKPLPLKINFSWTLSGNVIYATCQWGILAILAKLGDSEIVGQFAMGLAVTAPVIMFYNLQLRSIQATDARCEYTFGEYFALRLITTVLAEITILLIIFVSRYDVETSRVILAVGIAKGAESVIDIFYGLLQQRERMDRIAWSLMIKGPLSLLAIGINLYVFRNVFFGILWMAVLSIAVFLFIDIPNCTKVLQKFRLLESTAQYGIMTQNRILYPKWHLRALMQLGKLAFPLGLVMCLISLSTNIPRYFIEHYLGTRSLGIFTAMAYLFVAGDMVVNALGQAAIPGLAKYYASGCILEFRKMLFRLIQIGGLLGVAAVLTVILFGKEILTVFYTVEFSTHTDVFIWVSIAGALSYLSSIIGYGMTAARYFSIQLPLFAGVAVCSATACYLFIPRAGLIGAGWALLAAALFQLTGCLFINAFAQSRINKEWVNR
jgi:O-antigen/teichoic acid export membrane protein